MTLATLLIVLLIDRLLWQGGPPRQHAWYDRYSVRLLGMATGQWLSRHRLGAFLFLLPPLLVIVLLQWLGGETAGLIIGVLVLLFALGPDDLGRDTEAFVQARDSGQEEGAQQLAERISGGPADDTEPERTLQVAAATLVQSQPRLFAPIFWFIVLGPAGAALYRLARLTATRSVAVEGAPEELAHTAGRLVHLLDWLPARLTAAAFAVAGNFDAVIQAWRARPAAEEDIPASEGLLAATGRAALASWPDEEEVAAGELPPVVEDAMALVWRTLIVWLLAVAALTLIAGLL